LDKIKVLEVLPEKHFLSTKHTKSRPAKLCPPPFQHFLKKSFVKTLQPFKNYPVYASDVILIKYVRFSKGKKFSAQKCVSFYNRILGEASELKPGWHLPRQKRLCGIDFWGFLRARMGSSLSHETKRLPSGLQLTPVLTVALC
jgi:hypothetical protein